MRRHAVLSLMALLAPAGASGALLQSAPDGFVVEHKYVVKAAPDHAWAVLVHPERWWPKDHTWSGDARHLGLDPTAGGCFCERWEEGSAAHGRVVQARPGQLLCIDGALGPLQEMAVSAVLTIRLRSVPAGTEATVTYRVSGNLSQKLDSIAPAVDTVIGQQFGGFAALAAQ
jgi:uncharacterized protein YndB with AHSA1/START domain